jgi:hypothetical protein
MTRTNGGEPWTHPTSGEKLKRTRLGACLAGRLALKRCGKSGGFNLYWLANGSPPHPPHESFDTALRDHITKHGRLGEGLHRLCRLPPGDYLLEERSEGGQSLYRVDWQRWYLAAVRKNSGMVLKSR